MTSELGSISSCLSQAERKKLTISSMVAIFIIYPMLLKREGFRKNYLHRLVRSLIFDRERIMLNHVRVRGTTRTKTGRSKQLNLRVCKPTALATGYRPLDPRVPGCQATRRVSREIAPPPGIGKEFQRSPSRVFPSHPAGVFLLSGYPGTTTLAIDYFARTLC